MIHFLRAKSAVHAALAALATVALLGGSSGCSRGPKDKLEGKWLGDRIENVPSADLARATGWVKGAMLDFSGDKLTVTIPAEQPRTGTFKVAKVDGAKVTIDVTRASGQDADEATLTLVDEKSMRWDIGEGREIVLVRAQ